MKASLLAQAFSDFQKEVKYWGCKFDYIHIKNIDFVKKKKREGTSIQWEALCC